MSFDVGSPAYAVLLSGIHHPLAVNLKLGHVQNYARRRHPMECLAHKSLLEGGYCRRGHHSEVIGLLVGVWVELLALAPPSRLGLACETQDNPSQLRYVGEGGALDLLDRPDDD